MSRIFYVALGGAAGSVCRYLVSLIPLKGNFPFNTFFTNLLGAVLIGFIVGLATNGDITESQVLFWKVGICGGFTTFSTFSLEALQLLEAHRYLSGGIYIALSIFLCILGVILGRNLSLTLTAK